MFDPLPQGATNAWAADALTAELGMRAYPPRPPLSRSPLLAPWRKSTLAPLAGAFVARQRGRASPAPNTWRPTRSCCTTARSSAAEEDMVDIAAAAAKVARHLGGTA